MLDGSSHYRDARVDQRAYAIALEPGRLIDVALNVSQPGRGTGIAFWVSVDYRQQRQEGPSLKADASFAWKLANAHRDERIVAGHLDALGHAMVGTEVREPPFIVVIAQGLGGDRGANQDLVCARCGVRVEVKGRPRDRRSRLSSSRRRPFVDENRPEDLQVFVYEHERISVLRNRDLLSVVSQLRQEQGSHDGFVDLDPDWVAAHELLADAAGCNADA
ncbi:MAG: hypothetical protein LC777_12905 [Actinobacteria bacterium]|nr:hypothetical protein [Actinomycetota bacterium]